MVLMRIGFPHRAGKAHLSTVEACHDGTAPDHRGTPQCWAFYGRLAHRMQTWLYSSEPVIISLLLVNYDRNYDVILECHVEESSVTVHVRDA